MQILANAASEQPSEYALSNAILLYSDVQKRNVVFASVHDVSNTTNGSQIEAGVPVSKIGLLQLLSTLSPEEYVQPELLDETILAKGNDYLVWWCKPQKRSVFFACKEMGKGEVAGVTSHPGLVFIIAKGKWFVFAVKGRTRPTANTPLYEAPYMNVWAGGHICVGNIVMPKGSAKFDTKKWESSFFDSKFAHPNQQAGSQTKFKDGMYAMWRELLKGTPFSNDWLVKSKETLAQAFGRTVLHGSSN